MKALKIGFGILYRIWFYLLLGIPILVLLPFLLISILKEKWYPYFFALARIWAKVILLCMGFYVKVEAEEKIKKGESYMFVANHTSMVDIMLMLSVVRNPFVFVGKKELAKIPLFGFFYKRTCILVDRKNSKSRMEVFKKAEKRLHQGLSICIFPEGSVPDDGVMLDTFKDGAFRLALEHQIPIVPMTFPDNKKRLPYRFFGVGVPGLTRVKIHHFFDTKDKDLEYKKNIKSEVRHVILKQLHVYAEA